VTESQNVRKKASIGIIGADRLGMHLKVCPLCYTKQVDLNNSAVKQLEDIYKSKKQEIISRLREFERIWTDGNDEEIFTELVFCLFTPQSKAKSCWEAVLCIKDQGLLFKGTPEEIKQRLHRVRFHNNKARYLVEARNLFFKSGSILVRPLLKGFANIYETREWLVNNIKGIGHKEASHFLRNIGLGEKIAILDRHILRNLDLLNVIAMVPGSLGRARYLQIEKKMADFSEQIKIPLSHLDLLLWYKETGEIFK
jgi:N-glycosylase/DNA lyase